jgi:RNase adapter protein RapZ
VRYVLGGPETKEFLRHTLALLKYVMPKYEREGKSYLTIAIGCTGGRHRSVVIADEIARELSLPAGGARIAVLHRDARRGSVAPSDDPTGQVEAAEYSRDGRPSALELKGATSPPPLLGVEHAATQPSGRGEGR